MGLESWCVKHIYRHVCRDLFEIRKQLASKKLSYYKMENLNRLLIGALLINPEMVTFWNMKRELVECDLLNMNKELQFVKIVLSNKPKSNEAFTYRRWLLKRLLNKFDANELTVPSNLLENELVATLYAAEKAQNNYHSWTHRIWCIENIAKRQSNVFNIICDEFEWSANWISSHISEYSGFHYRQYIINLFKTTTPNDSFNIYYNFIVDCFKIVNTNVYHYFFGKQTKNICKHLNMNYLIILLYDLFNFLPKLSDFYTNHETFWYHRRFLLNSILQFAYNYFNIEKTNYKINDLIFNTDSNINIINSDFIENLTGIGEKQPKLFKCEPNRLQQCKLYEVLLNNEKAFIAHNLYNNAKFQQTIYAKRHQKWLKFLIGFECD